MSPQPFRKGKAELQKPNTTTDNINISQHKQASKKEIGLKAFGLAEGSISAKTEAWPCSVIQDKKIKGCARSQVAKGKTTANTLLHRKLSTQTKAKAAFFKEFTLTRLNPHVTKLSTNRAGVAQRQSS